MKRRFIQFLMLALIMIISHVSYAQMPESDGRFGGGRQHDHLFMRLKNLLTEEQMQEVKDMIREMHQSGASRLEIHTAVMDLLEFWGIDYSDVNENHLPRTIWKQLTDEQKETLKNTMKSMQENGATEEEIREVVNGLLDEWGIDLSEFRQNYWRRILHHRLMDQLTDEQQEEIKALVEEMRANDAAKEEIFAAVKELLESWGIDVSDTWGERKNERLPREILEQLTEAQRTELIELIQKMRDDDATREEIYEAITDLLVHWGIELPEDWGEGPKNTEQPEENKLTNYQLLDGVTNHPNPFNPDTHISYSLHEASNISVKIYNMNGNQVRTLENKKQEAGSYTLYWDGLNEKGMQCPSGMYLVKIDAGSETVTHNIILMK
ncbi:MAG: T9SS type A sorting domain-containing protein [Candidatus Marinimicrobia bacterium]|nr:T9SS type A sorting domain-containing protein [Candidatus Neomarinimicrobiota bacterium]